VALILTACGGAQDVANGPDDTTETTRSAAPSSTSTTRSAEPSTPTSDPASAPTTTPTTTPTSQPLAGRPQVGDCYDTSRRAFARQNDGSFPVSCARPHTAETFAVVTVGPLPSARAIDKVWRHCQPRFKTYVGGSPTISTIGFTVMLPSTAQAAAGQGWIRCDAMEQPSYNGHRGITRRGSLQDALSSGVPAKYRGCALHWPKVDHPVIFSSCKRRHQAELIPESLHLGGPEAKYPGLKASRSRSRQFCESTFQDYVTETLNYYFYFPTPASWRSGSHDTACWALDIHGDGLPPI
jgi:hypothetical protein